MANKNSGLGKGLDSLIPKKTTKPPLPKSSPVVSDIKDEVVKQVAIGEIHGNPEQPRKDFNGEGLEELAQSIRSHGIIQPLIVSQDQKGYQIIAGERRWRASKLAQLKTLPVIVRNVKNHQKLELALIENIQRKNLNAIEEAVAYQRLLDEFNFTHDELAKRVGKSRPVISNALRLLQLPKDIQQAVIDEKINYTVARFLAGLKGSEQKKYYKKALADKLPIQALEGHAKKENVKVATKTYKRRSKDPNVVAKEEELQQLLGTMVTIQKNGDIGRISIQFYSDEEFNDLLQKLKSIQ